MLELMIGPHHQFPLVSLPLWTGGPGPGPWTRSAAMASFSTLPAPDLVLKGYRRWSRTLRTVVSLTTARKTFATRGGRSSPHRRSRPFSLLLLYSCQSPLPSFYLRQATIDRVQTGLYTPDLLY